MKTKKLFINLFKEAELKEVHEWTVDARNNKDVEDIIRIGNQLRTLLRENNVHRIDIHCYKEDE